MRSRKLFSTGAITLITIFLSCVGGLAFAQDHDRERDRGRDRPRFEDRDRQAARGWFSEHHGHLPAGLRERDRLSPGLESQLQVGIVLDRDLRHRIHPVPEELLERLPPCPRHYRYVIIGDHICLIDDQFEVFDVIHFELNF